VPEWVPMMPNPDPLHVPESELPTPRPRLGLALVLLSAGVVAGIAYVVFRWLS